MTSLARWLRRVSARVDPMLNPKVAAHAEVILVWAGSEPDDAAVGRFAKALAGTRNGATWAELVEFAQHEDNDAADLMPWVGECEFDPHRLTRPQLERAAELRARLLAVGPEGLRAEERADAEHLRAIFVGSDLPDRGQP